MAYGFLGVPNLFYHKENCTETQGVSEIITGQPQTLHRLQKNYSSIFSA